ncbi:MAG: C-terminal binding protein [Gemmatimonadaceae bacterium]|nr:C-terminal binding protein [Gemmatimonadaceae bacterium]
MSRYRVAVARGSVLDLDSLRQLASAEADLIEFEPGRDPSPRADALVVALQKVDAALLDSFEGHLKVVGRAGIGLDSVDLIAARARDIRVINEPDYATEEVASHALAMLLAVHRRLPQGDAAVRAGWASAANVGMATPMSEATLGVVGAGRIGGQLVRMAAPLFGEVLVSDPADVATPEGATSTDLPDLLRRSQLVSLHMPLNASTRHLFDSRTLALMPRGSILVNVSRGGLIDEAALHSALASGALAGAGLDVFEQEPLPDSSPLRSAPNLLMSPHVAWSSSRSGRRLAEWIIQDVVAYLSGARLPHGQLVIGSQSSRRESQT